MVDMEWQGPLPKPQPVASPVFMFETADAKELYLKKLPDGRIQVSTWVSRKGPQSYFILDDDQYEIMMDVLKELKEA